jgi:hypothetical protein
LAKELRRDTSKGVPTRRNKLLLALVLPAWLVACHREPVFNVTVCVSDFEYQGTRVTGENVIYPNLRIDETESRKRAILNGCNRFCADRGKFMKHECTAPCADAGKRHTTCRREKRKMEGGGDRRGVW